MTSIDWLWLVHPVLAVVLLYPLLGAVLRLSLQVRQRRLRLSKAVPASAGSDHVQFGRWLAAGVVLIELLAMAVVILTKASNALPLQRAGLLLLVLMGTVASLAALWRVRLAVYRVLFAGICWVGVLALGLQPEVWRLSDNPLDPAFWQSHFWGGMGLTGLMLFSVAAQPEIYRQLRWRRLHLSANILAALIFVAQGITGPRDLLEIPLSWQKPLIQTCDFSQRVCPAPPQT
jgi:hypothetical protein